MDTARDFCAGEPGTDFETFRGGDGEHGVGEHGFEFVEDGLAEADGTVADDAGDGAADGVARVAVFLDEGRHAGGGRGVGTADGDEVVDFGAGDVVDEGEELRVR